ncbi:MAG: hypothetical protein VB108_05725 [Anaerolineaceae bacterium]|nr:hypothetical protein [Anaerolineaceae bacterium]
MKRLSRIFQPDKKTVIVAMDHGMGLSVNPALNETGKVLEKIVKGGADAILTTVGIAKTFASELADTALILRIDGGGSLLTPEDGAPEWLYTIEDALRLGADAVACMGFQGMPYERRNMHNLARIVGSAHVWGVPVLAEMLPGGFSGKIESTAENLVLSARTGCDYGADIIKTNYCAPKEEFKKVIEASYKPIVILGGEKGSKGLDGLYRSVADAMEVGAAGVAIGRNVWKDSDPEGVTRALCSIVHGK